MVDLFKSGGTEKFWNIITGMVGYGHKFFPAIIATPSTWTRISPRGRSPGDLVARADPNSPARDNNVPFLSNCGVFLIGATDPHPHIRSAFSALLGAIHRFCRRTPEPNRSYMRRLRRFTARWCRKNLHKVDRDLLEFYSWL